MKPFLFFCFTFLAISRTAAQFTPPVVIAHSPFYEYHHRPYDWDGDGDLDYIGEYEHTILHLYENAGDGKLLNPVVIDTFPFNWNLLYGAEFADLNADGLTDIIFANYPSELLVCLQMPGGEFAEAEAITGVSGTYSDTELADMDGDGDTDLVVKLDSLHWFENEGSGHFQVVHFIAQVPDQLFHVSDVNIDGLQDIFTFSPQYDTLRLLLHTAADTFLTKIVVDTLLYNLSSLRVVDVDGDGLPDWLPGSSAAPDNRWSKNLGDGNFAAPQLLDPTTTLPQWSQGSQTSAGDVDGDGDMDLVTKGADTLVWFENTGNAVYTTHLLSTGLNVLGINGPYAHDWNEDGLPDIVCTKSASAIAYYPGLGNGEFGPMVFIAPEVINAALTPADVDGDGLTDLFITANPDYRVGWYRNLGNDQWAARQNIDPEEYYVSLVKPGDFDNDGDSDVLVVRQDVVGGWPYEHALTRYKNLGNGQFSPADTLALLPYITASVADIDMDGDQDIVTMADGPAPSGVWMPNDGTGIFGAPVFFDPGSDTISVHQVSDLDRDGDPDLLVLLNPGIGWYTNDGAGLFEGPYLLSPNDVYYNFIGAADIDNDSFPDLVFNGQNGPVWSRNPGDGGMVGPPQPIHPETPNSVSYLSASMADINSDGMTDFIGFFNDRAYGWIPNLGNGVFGERIILGAYHTDYYITFQSADLDNDGDQEFIYSQTHEFGYYNDFSGLPDVHGHCFVDENANGQQDAGEPDLPGIGVPLDPSATISQTNADGAFRFFALPGQYNIAFQYDSCWVLTTDSAALQLSLPLPIGTELAFGFRPNLAFNKINSIIASAPPVCGQTVPFWLVLHNVGCHTAKARYRFEIDSLLTWAWSGPEPYYIVDDTISWLSLLSLEPGETRILEAFLTISPAIAGDVPVVKGIAETLDSDGTTVLHADTFLYPVPVLCSFDPNDKLVNVATLPPNYTTDSSLLTYTIRFQNTGNFTAFNIRVRDTLDAALDWNSFEPLAASHTYFVTVDTAAGLVQFDFPDIRLADSTSNEPESHGFVAFSIRLKPGLPPGSSTRNRAGIYFDVNAPVITNWAETAVRMPVSTRPVPVISAIRLAPNPVAEVLTVSFSEKIIADARVQVFDLRGQMVLEKHVPGGLEAYALDVSALPAAAYLLKINGKDGAMGQAFFVKI
ncbi:MAG: VCBS repeat-containing protein [Saprospiraceae bacterium]|nr:VCBS repeat-containing protein [Saprospiraceae bacterium]